MRIKNNQDGKTNIGGFGGGEEPPIPFVREESKGESKQSESARFRLLTDPNAPDSPKFDITVNYFEKGTCEDFLKFKIDFVKVVTGQKLTTGVQLFALARRLLTGAALAQFNVGTTELGDTTDDFNKAWQALTAAIFPQRAVDIQKRYMRKELRKPKHYTIRGFLARFNELNSYLTDFPPLFNATQMLQYDDIIDILECAIPVEWQNSMMIHGFKPKLRPLAEFIEFCERHEQAEAKKATRAKSDTTESTTKTTSNSTAVPVEKKQKKELFEKKAGGRKVPREKSERWCILHKTSSHSTNECKVMLAQAEKLTEGYAKTDKEVSKKNPSDNNKKPAYQKNEKKREALCIERIETTNEADEDVDTWLEEQLNAMDRTRNHEETLANEYSANNPSDSDSDSDLFDDASDMSDEEKEEMSRGHRFKFTEHYYLGVRLPKPK